MSNQDCRKNTKYNEKMISDNMLCAGYPEGMKDSCQVCSATQSYRAVAPKLQMLGLLGYFHVSFIDATDSLLIWFHKQRLITNTLVVKPKDSTVSVTKLHVTRSQKNCTPLQHQQRGPGE
jgi:hypothetical protein